MDDKLYDTSLDFLKIRVSFEKNRTEISPDYTIYTPNGVSTDLMIRGKDFYAIWLADKGTWSTNEYDAVQIIDKELKKCYEEHSNEFGFNIKIKYLRYASTGSINLWHKFVKEQTRDSYKTLNQTLVFSNTPVTKEMYSSVRLGYPLAESPISAYEKLISTLYDPAERFKLEWCIGAIVSGDAPKVHKFAVLYGAPGTGKSTILKIIYKMFGGEDGYCTSFSAKTLGGGGQFPFEAFRKDPLVAIDHEGNMSKIEDNENINSLTSHDSVLVNIKNQSAYPAKFNTFLFVATNKHVKITDAKSGLVRRLIDISPSGRTVPGDQYDSLVNQVESEFGGIALHCMRLYKRNKRYFDDYTPVLMLSATNDFYNFIIDTWTDSDVDEGISVNEAWVLYCKYCDDAKVKYPLPKKSFQDEIKNYFTEYYERYTKPDGTRIRRYLKGLDLSKYEHSEKAPQIVSEEPNDIPVNPFMDFKEQSSALDILCANDKAQYAKLPEEIPITSWAKTTTTLNKIDTRKLHYLKPSDEHHVFVDFDLKDAAGNKSFALNLEAASKFPPTYAELSKGGQGIHLHYIYAGDPSQLARLYAEHIEIKVCTGGNSIRRRLSKCNSLDISTISGFLPVKGEPKVLNQEDLKNEKHLQALIEKALKKKIHPDTRSNIDFIAAMLDKAYDSGMPYDLRRMYDVVVKFAAHSTHQSEHCLEKVLHMKFCSDDNELLCVQDALSSSDVSPENDSLYAFDCEVFQNLFVICWGPMDTDEVFALVNPSDEEVRALFKYKLVGFNNRKYDNHILYARTLGYDNLSLYKLSSSIINNRKGESSALFKNAYSISATDIYDFSSEKKSLKKWEIELKKKGMLVAHKECPIPWDKPVPKELWDVVVEYCMNDVAATKAVFHERQADFMARKIQVDIVKRLHGIENVSINDTTNSLSAKIVFGRERHPQTQFNYRDLSKPVPWTEYERYRELFGPDYEFHIFDANGLPTYDIYDGEHGIVALPDGWSILPFFPGYKYEGGVSTYLGWTIGEGGRVYSHPGMYGHVWDGDVTSMHPHSAIAEVAFGPKYTKVLKDLVDARVAIKEERFDDAALMMGGVLKPYLNKENAKGLAQALKIIINSIYGLTSAKFDNVFRDPRNIDNIIAKRGALFMTLLMSEVEKRGFTVAHIKTDSIKIPNPTQEIIDFVCKFGKEYGYTFTTEYDFDRYCLVNDAVYIARVRDGKDKGTWVAVGDQFKVPYVFKSLFSHEDICFDDLCETFNVNTSLYLDMNEHLEDTAPYEKELAKLEKKDINPERQQELKDRIAANHNYQFIGRIGLFCPVRSGFGGGVLVRKNDNTGGYNSAGGAKGYRWLEADTVKATGSYNDIVDYSYYTKLVDDAVAAISNYGDFEWFVSDQATPDFPINDEIPF